MIPVIVINGDLVDHQGLAFMVVWFGSRRFGSNPFSSKLSAASVRVIESG